MTKGVKLRQIFAAGVFAIAMPLSAHAECNLGALYLGYESFVCVNNSKTASLTGRERPECISELRQKGQQSLEKAKACFKKNKDPDGLRALAEFWVTWDDALSEMRTGGNESIQLKYDRASKAFELLKAMN